MQSASQIEELLNYINLVEYGKGVAQIVYKGKNVHPVTLGMPPDFVGIDEELTGFGAPYMVSQLSEITGSKYGLVSPDKLSNVWSSDLNSPIRSLLRSMWVVTDIYFKIEEVPNVTDPAAKSNKYLQFYKSPITVRDGDKVKLTKCDGASVKCEGTVVDIMEKMGLITPKTGIISAEADTHSVGPHVLLASAESGPLGFISSHAGISSDHTAIIVEKYNGHGIR